MTNSFNTGIESAKLGNSIDNSYPFDHDEFVAGYKSIKPNTKTLLDQYNTPESKLAILTVMEISKNG